MAQEINSGMNLYEFNRVNMGKLPILETAEELEGAKIVIENFINDKLGTYYMMLNHERKDFTLFNFLQGVIIDSKIETMANDILECMDNRGLGIIDISPDEVNMSLEIWVKERQTDAVYMYLLFPYNFGVIEY